MSFLPNHCLLWVFLALSSPLVLSQTIQITVPKLPPRAAEATPQANQTPSTPQAATPPGAVTNAAAAQAQGTAQTESLPNATPSPRAPEGVCKADHTPDRQTIVLVSGPQALPRTQLPMGEFRVHQIVHSPDGKWAVAFLKLRGAQQFAALSIDLDNCKAAGPSANLAAEGRDVSFDAENATLVLGKGSQVMKLRDGRVR